MDRQNAQRETKENRNMAAFTPEERKTYLKGKWKSEHIILYRVKLVLPLLIGIISLFKGQFFLVLMAAVLGLFLNAAYHQRMNEYLKITIEENMEKKQ